MGRSMPRWMFALVFAFYFLSNTQVWAQAADAKESTAADEVAKFASKSQLVMVPVVVTGKNGEHVSGLKRDAFKIEEQGKAREATIFEEVKPTAENAPQQAAAKLEGRSNFNFEEAPSGHLTVVVLDLLNTPYLGQGDGIKRLAEYLSKTLPRNEAAAVFGLGLHGITQLHEPTTDTAALLRALKGITEPPSKSESAGQAAVPGLNNAQSQDDNERQAAQEFSRFVRTQGTDRWDYDFLQASWTTLEAMTQIARAYSKVPGRKTLIWATAGFPYLAASVGISRNTLVEKYERTWRELVEADIAVYSVDVSDLAGFKGTLVSYRSMAHKQQTLREFAEATGGVPCMGIANDVEKCFARAVADSSSYYLLGYYLPTNDQKPGWRKLKVKVEGDGVHVRAREGFSVSAATVETPEERHRQLVRALHSPIEFTGVRFNVRELPLSGGSKATTAKGAFVHEFSVGVLGDSITVDAQNGNSVNLSIVGVVVGADGLEHGHVDHVLTAKLPGDMVEKFRKTGLSSQQSLELSPGKYNIRFAVRDNLSGEIGTVIYPMVVK